ncbi:glycerate kinase [Dactylosporangium fulvum]|uniref:Glycerate kinase n=1 Tax=Dactylosporangium fulvum TaxID=53359 RepID=A0ABY5W930_9ACTN|nr:glycerate kinase [Dactylosporangium fulvum]UWP86602.1 glycerate kinase [Dactylosporangium fulvum]
MRILVAPDKFAGTLSAPEAAAAIADGWKRQAPGDHVDMAPMADGGPGFVDVLHTSLGGQVVTIDVRGPFGDRVPASFLLVGGTAYIESAHACGRHLTDSNRAEHASTYGVGELVLAAQYAGATRVVVGLGGSGSNDGGAGLLAAFGATADRPLDAGVAGLEGVTHVDLPPSPGAELVIATDVDNPLVGPTGATKVFGPQKGIPEAQVVRWDAALAAYGTVTGRMAASAAGAGAAGGLGHALLLLGAARRSGVDVVAEAVRLSERTAHADLVVTGEGSFDRSSAGGKVPAGVAARAAEAGRPCVVLAGRVDLQSADVRALGVDAAYSLVETLGVERALREPAAALADLASRVARARSR